MRTGLEVKIVLLNTGTSSNEKASKSRQVEEADVGFILAAAGSCTSVTALAVAMMEASLQAVS